MSIDPYLSPKLLQSILNNMSVLLYSFGIATNIQQLRLYNNYNQGKETNQDISSFVTSEEAQYRGVGKSFNLLINIVPDVIFFFTFSHISSSISEH
jgi:hypothetical protein